MSSDYEKDDSITEIDNLHEALDDKEGESIIINILCSKSNSELQEIKKEYENKYNENLNEKLNKKLKSNLKELIQGLLQDPIEYDSNEIFKAVDGIGTDDDTLIEIISTRSQDHLKDVSKKYFETRKESMENAIKNDTSQAYGRLITKMSKGERSENPYPNISEMKKICSQLKGEKNKKLDKDVFVKYFSQCSNSELIMIYKIFEKENKKNLLDFINEKFGADSRNLYKAIFSYLASPIKYFTERIHTWKDKIVIRNFVSQRDNLKEIKEEYKKLYDKDLEDDIKKNTKDGFQKALLCLVSQ